MTASPGARLPTARTLFRGVTLACAVCGQRRLFRRWFGMADDCPRCGLHFERAEGMWIGAVAINTIVTIGALLITGMVGIVVTRPDTPVLAVTLLTLAVTLVLPIVLFPFSRTIWLAADCLFRPIRDGEVDPAHHP